MNRNFMDKAAAAGGRKKTEPAKGDPNDAALSALEKQVFRLHTDIEKYMRLIDQLGTPKDTVTLRASISLRKDETQRKAKALKEQFSDVNRRKHEFDAKLQERLKKSAERFAQHLDEFQKALKMCADREVAAPPIMTSSLQSSSVGGDAEENEYLLKQQQQQEVQRLDNMVAYNEAIIDERDQEIQGLVRDIGELNEMFQDVAVLVQEQGEQLTVIETNAEVTADRVQAGRTELETAEKSQQAASRKKFCLALVSGAVAGVIGAILIFMA